MKFKFLFLFTIVHLIAQAQETPFDKLKRAAQKQAPEKTQLASVKVERTNPKWKAMTKAPIPFTPFELKDKEGKPVNPNTPHTLKSGKVITAKEYVDRLNEIEKRLNDQGFTLRTMEPVVVSKTVTPPETLDGKVAEQTQSVGAFREGANLTNFMNPQRKIGNVFLKPLHLYSKGERDEINKYDFTETGGKVTNSKIVGPRKWAAIDIFSTNLPLKTINITNTKGWSFGDPSTFQAGIEGSLLRFARIYAFNPNAPEKSMSEFKVSATGKAYGSLFSHSLDLLNATGTFFAPADTSKKMTAGITVKAAGITIFNLSKEYPQVATFSDVVGKSFDKSFPIEIPIGYGFDFKGKIGVKGDAGFQYFANLYRSFANVGGTPLVNLEGYAEAGIEFLDLIGGGVGGKLTFIKGQLELSAFAGIWSQNAEQIVLAISYYFGYSLDMLSGSLYAYVEACAPWIGCWRPVEHEFYSWNGYKKSGTITEGTESYVIANIAKKGRPELRREQ